MRLFEPLLFCDRPMLRQALLDREVGICARYGVEAVEPYAVCAQGYAALPKDLACGVGSKARLAQAVLDGRIPDYALERTLERPKVRVHVPMEGEPGGTLPLP